MQVQPTISRPKFRRGTACWDYYRPVGRSSSGVFGRMSPNPNGPYRSRLPIQPGKSDRELRSGTLAHVGAHSHRAPDNALALPKLAVMALPPDRSAPHPPGKRGRGTMLQGGTLLLFLYSGFIPISSIIFFCSAVHVPDMSPCCIRSFFCAYISFVVWNSFTFAWWPERSHSPTPLS